MKRYPTKGLRRGLCALTDRITEEPTKIINLAIYRANRKKKICRSILFLTVSAETELIRLGFLPEKIVIVTERCQLLAATLNHFDLCLIDSAISWEDPVYLIRKMAHNYPVIVMHSRASLPSPFVTKAYTAGASDFLFTPTSPEEFHEITEVLLKLKNHTSLSV